MSGTEFVIGNVASMLKKTKKQNKTQSGCAVNPVLYAFLGEFRGSNLTADVVIF